jgi:regulator of CtrA degradation
MSVDHAKRLMTARLVDSLYTEAMVLADEARSYFDRIGRGERDALTPIAKVAFSCESLRVTTRLMHVIAWLLTRKAISAGEISEDDGRSDSRRLGQAADSDPAALVQIPDAARDIVLASIELYNRVERIDQGLVDPEPVSPALQLMRRVERAL